MGTWAWGQTGVGRLTNDPRGALQADEDIPVAALQTDEGFQLAGQLQSLHRTYSTLGPNHPSIGKVRSEIESVKRRLAAFNSLSGEASGVGSQAAPENVPAVSNAQWHDLVLAMTKKIERLETRVSTLERRLQAR